MLYILLLILKIILWVILAALGLAILLILLVLLAPICYRADVDFEGKARVKAKASFLVVSVNVIYDQLAGNLDNTIRICGVRLGKGRKNKSDKLKNSEGDFADEALLFESTADVNGMQNSDTETKTTEPETAIPEKVLRATEEPVTTMSETAEPEATIPETAEPEATIPETAEPDLTMPDKAAKKAEKKQKREQKKQLREEKRNAKKNKPSVSDKRNALKKKLHRLKAFWELKCTMKTRAYLKKYIISILKHISPRKINGYVIYGFDDPATTGNVTGYLSLMPFVYQKNFNMMPDFHNKVFETKLKLKGRMHIGYLLRFVFNINIWRTIKSAKKFLA